MSELNNDVLKRQAVKEEPRFLSILLKEKESLMEAVACGIKKEHFWTKEARVMFDIIHKYYMKHNTVLTRTAIESITDSSDIGDGGSLNEEDKACVRMYWDKVFSNEVSPQDFSLLLKQISNRYVQMQAYKILKNNIDKINDATNNQDNLVKELREDLLKIEGIDPDPYTLIMNMDEGLDKVMDYISNKRENPDDRQTVMTGIQTIDNVYCGLEYGSYTIITGMINGGKTTLMFNVAFNMAKAGYNVVYVSLEKKAVAFYTRLLALHALVDYNRIRRGGKDEKGLDDFHFTKLQEAANELKTHIQPNLICIQMAQGTKLSKILAEVDRINNNLKDKKKKIDALVVDYLGAIGNETVTPGRSDLDDARTSQRLQSYGRINNFVTITAAQLKTQSSKDIRNKSKKANDDASNVEVNTEDIGGSKMIIADADFALGVVLNGDCPPTKMFVFTTKARDAESRRTLVLDFDGKLGRISDPVFEPGQVKEIDDLLYNKEIKEEDLQNDDGLFSQQEIQQETPQNDNLFDDEVSKNSIIEDNKKDLLGNDKDLDNFLDVN